MKRCHVRSVVHAVTYVLYSGLALAAGCDRLGAPGSPRPELKLAPDSAVLAIHGSVRLSAEVTGVAGDTTVAYRSSDASVAVVDSSGTVRAVGYGTAWVQASLRARPSLADSVLVRVPEPSGPWLLLSPDTLSLPVGGSGQLTWRVGHVPEPAPAVIFSSSDTSVLDARANGLLCPRKQGDALVRAGLAAYPTAVDSGRVRVQGYIVDAPPTVSIAAIVDSAGKAVNLAAVRGTIRVNVNVDTPSWPCLTLPPFVLELRFDGNLWQTSPQYVWGSHFEYTFTVDTRATDAAGHALLPNGSHTLSVVARTPDGVARMAMSLGIVVAN